MDHLPDPLFGPAGGSSKPAVSAAIDAAALARAVVLPADAVEVLESVGSTNLWLLHQPWPQEPAGPRLVVAHRQTAGRGRRGRTWLSGGAESLTFSVAFELRMPEASGRLSGLSVATGVAIAECLSGLTDGIGLKWPNDLQRHGRKVAGLLLESRLQADRVRVVAGLGLNLVPADGWLDRIEQPAGSLFDGSDRVPARDWLVATLARVMINAGMGPAAVPGQPTLAQRWARFDVLFGGEVVVLFDGVTVQAGIASGIDENGALRLRSGSGEQRINAGEVSVRRQEPGAGAGP